MRLVVLLACNLLLIIGDPQRTFMLSRGAPRRYFSEKHESLGFCDLIAPTHPSLSLPSKFGNLSQAQGAGSLHRDFPDNRVWENYPPLMFCFVLNHSNFLMS